MCTKYHLKFLELDEHKITNITDLETRQIIPLPTKAYFCPKHKHEQVQLYCADHEQPCCGLCGVTEHKKCNNVYTIDIAGQRLKENGDIDSILNDTNTYKEELFRAKANSENNILEIENTVDAKRSQFEEEFKLIIQHLNDLKNKFLDELSTTLKRGREELSNQILTLEDGILCINYCKNGIQMAKDADSNTERLMKFHTALEQSSGDLTSLKNIAIVNVVKTSHFIEFDINNIELLEFKRFQLGKRD